MADTGMEELLAQAEEQVRVFKARAEAAEKERDEARDGRAKYRRKRDELRRSLHAAEARLAETQKALYEALPFVAAAVDRGDEPEAAAVLRLGRAALSNTEHVEVDE